MFFLCVFCVVFMFPKKINKKDIGVWPIRVFVGYLDFSQLDKTPKCRPTGKCTPLICVIYESFKWHGSLTLQCGDRFRRQNLTSIYVRY